jgi:hypothetical protein
MRASGYVTVPIEKIVSRYARSNGQLARLVGICDRTLETQWNNLVNLGGRCEGLAENFAPTLLLNEI